MTVTDAQLNAVAHLSVREAAKQLGMSKSAVQRARTKLVGGGGSSEPDGTVTVEVQEAPQTLPEADQLLRDKGIDPERYSVSYGFSQWGETTGARIKAVPKREDKAEVKLDPQELLDAIGDFDYTYTPEGEDVVAGGTFIITPSDMQIGKTSYNGGTKETIERVQRSFAAAADFARAFQPSEIIIAELGDPLENFYNTSSQRETNDLDITGQLRVARRLLLEGIKLLAPLAPRVVYATVPSNHGSVRVGFKAQAGDSHNDWGLEISHQLEDAVRENPSLEHVAFIRPEHLHESLNYKTVDGTNIGMVHGHQARAAEKLGEWWKGQSHGRRPTHESDILLAGHWHSFRVQQSGASRTIIVSPASDPGSDWFTELTGESSMTGMVGFTTQNGAWDNLRVY